MKIQVFAEEAETLDSITVTSEPLDGDTYKEGENLEIEYKFSTNVDHSTGTASLNLGSQARKADYISGSGTNTLLYSYRVQSADVDTTNGFNIGANSLGANGSSNVVTTDDGYPLTLTHSSQDAGNDHKVNGGTAGCLRFWCADLSVAAAGGPQVLGFHDPGPDDTLLGSLSNRVVRQSGAYHLVDRLVLEDGNLLKLALDRAPSQDLLQNTRLRIGTRNFALSTGTQDANDNSITWSGVGLTWSTGSTVRVSIDTLPTVTVEFGASAYSTPEGGTQMVTVELSADPVRAVAIPIVTTNQGTATSSDYSGVPQTVTFNETETSKSFVFAATQDDIDDDGESVKLGFGTMPESRVSVGTTDEATVSIGDDDTAGITVAPAIVSVDEEDNVRYTVTLDTEPTVDVTVTIGIPTAADLTIQGTALSGNALTFTSADWDSPQEVRVVAAHDDDGVDDNPVLTHAAAGAEYDGVSSDLSVTVVDNDPLGIVFNPTHLTVDERDGADYAVSLATEPTGTVTVTISGHSGTDLTLSGSTLNGEALTFTAADWDTAQTVTVAAAHDDDIKDDSETLTHTGSGVEYAGITNDLPVTIDDYTGDLRLMDGQLTDPGNGDNPSEGRVEVYYDGEWCTICDDYWSVQDADVACRQLGFVGGAADDWDLFRNSLFPPGARGQTIAMDDLKCRGSESELAECGHRGWKVHNCEHSEDVGLRCVRNSEGPYVTGMEISGAPGGNHRYDVGETVTVTVVWSEAVNVDTTFPTAAPVPDVLLPHLRLVYGRPGGPRTRAVYASGTGTAVTTFSAVVEDRGNAPYPRIDVLYESLSVEMWNLTPGQDPAGSRITSVETGKEAILGHGPFLGPEPGSGQQVEATAATITGAPTFNRTGRGWRLGFWRDGGGNLRTSAIPFRWTPQAARHKWKSSLAERSPGRRRISGAATRGN